MSLLIPVHYVLMQFIRKLNHSWISRSSGTLRFNFPLHLFAGPDFPGCQEEAAAGEPGRASAVWLRSAGSTAVSWGRLTAEVYRLRYQVWISPPPSFTQLLPHGAGMHLMNTSTISYFLYCLEIKLKKKLGVWSSENKKVHSKVRKKEFGHFSSDQLFCQAPWTGYTPIF